MNELIALALRRAGVNTLAEFQALQGLPQTGEADPETQLALEPYLLGFRTIRIQPGDTYWELAARYGTTSQAIATANPSLDPERLPVGAPMRVPLGFPVVPTDVPMTSNLCSLCIRGLVGRYPGLCRMEALTTTAFGRPVEALTMGSGQRRVLYTAAHHANEWITATLLLAFAEDLAKAAMQDLGIEPRVEPIRGGTDGCRLSFMGLPCPNLCAGGHNAHGKYEYVSVQSLLGCARVLIRIAEKAAE